MRIAYLVTAYTQLIQLDRLCAALRREDPDGVILVQFDVGSPVRPSPGDLDVTLRLTEEPVQWGDGSYTREIIESIRVLAEQPWDWMVVISGQDYPIRPLALLHERLGEGGYSAYSPVSTRSHGGEPDSEELLQRYVYRYVWPRRRWPRPLRAAVRRFGGPLESATAGRLRIQPRPRSAAPGLGIRRSETIFSAERPCWMGSDYTAANREVCEKVLTFLDREPAILDYFDRTFVPSEALFASLYRWIDGEHVSGDPLHFMRFGGRTNPRVVTRQDLPELWDLGMVFARKFTDDDSWVTGLLPMREPPSRATMSE